jgi:hypothetical protein
MTRIATRNVKPSGRPEPLGGGAAPRGDSPVNKPGSEVSVAGYLPASHRIGYGPPAGIPVDARPDTIGPHDAALLRREEAARTRELSDLPDSGMIW